MKITAFAGSNSSTSINFELVKYATQQFSQDEVKLLNLANFPFPLYSEDLEKEKGFSNSLIELKNDIQSSDALVIGVNEHNGNPSAYFKNMLDWLSRLDRKFMVDKNVILLSTSPGGGGGKNALAVIERMLPHMGANITNTFSLPEFYKNFSKEEKKITNQELDAHLQSILNNFKTKINS